MIPCADHHLETSSSQAAASEQKGRSKSGLTVRKRRTPVRNRSASFLTVILRSFCFMGTSGALVESLRPTFSSACSVLSRNVNQIGRIRNVHRRALFSSCPTRLSSSSSSCSDAINMDASPLSTTKEIRQQKYQQLMEASTLQLAPMMEYTDRHFRHLVRLISSRTLLYTEMVAANALARERQDLLSRGGDIVNDGQYLRRFLAQGTVPPLEGASVLQLGGSDPEQLYQAAQCVTEFAQANICDYTALNLNCGCPSPKVAGKGCFGAALMEDAMLVSQLTQAMHEGSGGRFPVTVKCRIGLDTMQQSNDTAEDQYRRLCHFIETVAANGIVTDFAVHARIAVLDKSFSPADNRKIPQLNYEIVRRLVRDYSPHLTFTLNGGIDSIAQAQHELELAPGLNGVMTGRAWAADPWSFACADELLYGETTATESSNCRNRLQILEAYGRHADAEEAMGDPTKIRRFIVKAVMSLFTGEANAKRFRIALDEIAGLPKKSQAQGKGGSSLEGHPPLSELILSAAMEHLSQETLLRTPEESYARVLLEEQRRAEKNTKLSDGGGGGERVGRSASIDEWQKARSAEQDATDDASSSADSPVDQVVAG